MLILLELSSGDIFKSVFILLNLIFNFAILNDLDFFFQILVSYLLLFKID